MTRKYKAPDGSTGVSVNGVQCKPNKRGIVDVPDDADDEQLRAHGYVSVEDMGADTPESPGV